MERQTGCLLPVLAQLDVPSLFAAVKVRHQPQGAVSASLSGS
jgi:hypothetical protein